MSRPVRIVLRVVYWLAVLAVSVGILIALILFLEARDSSQVQNGNKRGSAAQIAVRLNP